MNELFRIQKSTGAFFFVIRHGNQWDRTQMREGHALWGWLYPEKRSNLTRQAALGNYLKSNMKMVCSRTTWQLLIMSIANTDPLVEFIQAEKTKPTGKIYKNVNTETQVIQL